MVLVMGQHHEENSMSDLSHLSSSYVAYLAKKLRKQYSLPIGQKAAIEQIASACADLPYLQFKRRINERDPLMAGIIARHITAIARSFTIPEDEIKNLLSFRPSSAAAGYDFLVDDTGMINYMGGIRKTTMSDVLEDLGEISVSRESIPPAGFETTWFLSPQGWEAGPYSWQEVVNIVRYGIYIAAPGERFFITIDGKTLSMEEVAQHTGIAPVRVFPPIPTEAHGIAAKDRKITRQAHLFHEIERIHSASPDFPEDPDVNGLPLTIAQAVKKQRSILVVGATGSGKTTMARYLRTFDYQGAYPPWHDDFELRSPEQIRMAHKMWERSLPVINEMHLPDAQRDIGGLEDIISQALGETDP
jgi:hypothetical protein